MKLENEILYVEMVEHGAELTRIYNKKLLKRKNITKEKYHGCEEAK